MAIMSPVSRGFHRRRQDPVENAGWSGYARRVYAALVGEVAWPAAAMPLAYACGPTSFVEALPQARMQSGYRRSE
jgi:hypothetical protein